jgi:hypothetical protein
MEIALIIIGLLILSGAGLWYLGVAFSESLFWGFTILGLSLASVFFSVGMAANPYSTELTVIFQVAYWGISLTFLYQYWEVVKKPFFLSIFGGIVLGAGIVLGGMSLLSDQGSGWLANLNRSNRASTRPASSPGGSYDSTGGPRESDEDMAMFDAIAEQYADAKEQGMNLDPRYDRVVRDYEAMRGRGTGSQSGSDRGQGPIHGGSSGPNPEPSPLIGRKAPKTPVGNGDFTVSSSDLLAASQAAKQGRSTGKPDLSGDPWYKRYRQATRPTIAAWQRVHRARNEPKNRKDLAPACQELFRSSGKLPTGIFKDAPDERITFNLTQAYETLNHVGRVCMAGKMSSMQTQLDRASGEMARAKAAMSPFDMTP